MTRRTFFAILAGALGLPLARKQPGYHGEYKLVKGDPGEGVNFVGSFELNPAWVNAEYVLEIDGPAFIRQED